MSLESRCRERLQQSEDGRQAVALLDAWERQINELHAEGERLRDRLDFEGDCLKAATKSGKDVCEQRDKLRVDLAEAKGTAKEALQNLDESEAEVTELKNLLEQRNHAYKLLWENYQREQRAHAVYRESAEDCMRILETECDRARPIPNTSPPLEGGS